MNTRLADELSSMASQQRRDLLHGVHTASSGKQAEIHANRLKEIVRTEGWPSPAKVGDRGSRDAFAILEKSDDEEFQKECLEKMRAIQKTEKSNALGECITELTLHLHL